MRWEIVKKMINKWKRLSKYSSQREKTKSNDEQKVCEKLVWASPGKQIEFGLNKQNRLK